MTILTAFIEGTPDYYTIDGYGSKSTNSDLAGFYLLLYIRQHAGLFRRRTNLNDVITLVLEFHTQSYGKNNIFWERSHDRNSRGMKVTRRLNEKGKFQ
jgi:hypothetical protein